MDEEERLLYNEIKKGWGKKEINFSDEQGNCNGCSECCTVFVPVTKEELKTLKRFLTKKIIKKTIKQFSNGEINAKCPFVTEKGCAVYNLRPQVCKMYHCNPSFKIAPSLANIDINDPPVHMLYQVFDDKRIIDVFDTILEVGSDGEFVEGRFTNNENKK